MNGWLLLAFSGAFLASVLALVWTSLWFDGADQGSPVLDLDAYRASARQAMIELDLASGRLYTALYGAK